MTSAFLPSHRVVPIVPEPQPTEDVASENKGQIDRAPGTASERRGQIERAPGTASDTEVAQAPAIARKAVSAAEIPDTPQRTQQVAMPIRVLIVDDHEIVRRGLYTILSEQEDFEVVGQTGTGRMAITLAMQLQPDIVILDIFLGASNGLDIAQQLQRGCRKTRIVILTGYSDEGHLFRAMRIGVHGYLQKSLPISELLPALRSVHSGERVIGEPRAITQVLGEFERLTKEQERVRSGLTDLEIELVRLAAEGCSNKEIASRQFWSEVTVKRKMQDIYRKLSVTDRAQAVAEAMRMGLI